MSNAVTIEIAQESDLWQDADAIEALITRAVARSVDVAALAHAPGAELSIVLTDDASIRQINAEWRGKDKATNVLSFPQAVGDAIATVPMLGDIIFAHETIAREAEESSVSFADHLSHLTVHGLLHLFGHDHLNDAEAEVMEALEVRILADLGIANPYADAPLLREAS
ncbi:rRNA maturation RNase YbeY [Labrys sp. ZIDIC5]|uniref:rRNA maturation RNase YbeY n=1 Tax=Labrys sedimenti TaxID=3106036 RepID=UPI002ACB0419|nr:rRNA maturation RNase YbeY [Labrys sp. ZIDIC5]MDZ5449440.1 rRNA maturation RNase YbeY [Labrys sp. ZIDIC5]